MRTKRMKKKRHIASVPPGRELRLNAVGEVCDASKKWRNTTYNGGMLSGAATFLTGGYSPFQ